MSEVAISIEDLSKIYKLGQIGTGSISHDLNKTTRTTLIKILKSLGWVTWKTFQNKGWDNKVIILLRTQ